MASPGITHGDPDKLSNPRADSELAACSSHFSYIYYKSFLFLVYLPVKPHPLDSAFHSMFFSLQQMHLFVCCKREDISVPGL